MTELDSPPQSVELTSKTALVTGGTTGIGRAFVRLLLRAGARVLLTGQNPDSLARARQELAGTEAVVLQADARSLDAAAAVAREVERRFGGLDIAFFNAGIAQLSPIDAVSEASYAEHMDVNVKGVVFTLQKVLPLLRPGASLVVNTSIADTVGSPNLSIYAASKGALAALVRSLAVELAPRNIRVNAVSPGPTHTPIQAKFGLPPELAESVRRDISQKIPLRRYGTADEVAHAALFLASPAASFVTGVELAVDGGMSAS